MREKTRVTASLLVLALHLISREDGANFLDQSQSLVKQHGQLLLALKRFHKTNLRQVCFLTLLAVEVCPRAKILRNNDFRYVKFTYLHCGEETNSWLVSSVGSAAPVSQSSWVQIPYGPEFFQVLLSTTSSVVLLPARSS